MSTRTEVRPCSGSCGSRGWALLGLADAISDAWLLAGCGSEL